MSINNFACSGPRSKSGGHAQDDVPPPPYTPDSLRKNGEDGKSSEKDCDDSGVEDALETLRAYDTFFLIDDSGSMTKKRWHEVIVISVVSQHDGSY